MEIYILSRIQLVEKLNGDFPSNTAVISFYDDGSKPINMKGKPVASISKCINDNRWARNPDKWQEEDFKEVAAFIIDCMNKGYDIICQCEFGVSRSSGCAMAIKEYYFKNGLEIFRNYDYYPNQIFFNNIYNQLCLLNGNPKE